MISIGKRKDETRFADPTGSVVILTENFFFIQLGLAGWGAGVGYRSPESIVSERDPGVRVRIPDYLMLARLLSLAIIVTCLALREVDEK